MKRLTRQARLLSTIVTLWGIQLFAFAAPAGAATDCSLPKELASACESPETLLPMWRWAYASELYSDWGGFSIGNLNPNALFGGAFDLIVEVMFTISAFLWNITARITHLALTTELLDSLIERMDRVYYSTAQVVVASQFLWTMLAIAMVAAAWTMWRKGLKQGAAKFLRSVTPLAVLLILLFNIVAAYDLSGNGNPVFETNPQRIGNEAAEIEKAETSIGTGGDDPTLVERNSPNAVRGTNPDTTRHWTPRRIFQEIHNVSESPSEQIQKLSIGLTSEAISKSSHCSVFTNNLEAMYLEQRRRKRARDNNQAKVEAPLPQDYSVIAISRLWQRGYLNGLMTAQFGSPQSTANGSCLWAEHTVTGIAPAETMAIWMAGCNTDVADTMMYSENPFFALGNKQLLGCVEGRQPTQGPPVTAGTQWKCNAHDWTTSETNTISSHIEKMYGDVVVGKDSNRLWIECSRQEQEQEQEQEQWACARADGTADGAQDLGLLEIPASSSDADLHQYGCVRSSSTDEIRQELLCDTIGEIEDWLCRTIGSSLRPVSKLLDYTDAGLPVPSPNTEYNDDDVRIANLVFAPTGDNSTLAFLNLASACNMWVGSEGDNDAEPSSPAAKFVVGYELDAEATTSAEKLIYRVSSPRAFIESQRIGLSGDEDGAMSVDVCQAWMLGGFYDGKEYKSEGKGWGSSGFDHTFRGGHGLQGSYTQSSNQSWTTDMANISCDEAKQSRRKIIIDRGGSIKSSSDNTVVNTARGLGVAEEDICRMSGDGFFNRFLFGLISLITAFLFMTALSGLAVGTVLAQIMLGVLVMFLPLLLLVSAIPSRAANSILKKCAKLAIVALFAHSIFLLLLSAMIAIIDVLTEVVVAATEPGDFLRVILVASLPLVAKKAVGGVGKQFGMDITSFKGALAATSGMAAAQLKPPEGNPAMRAAARTGDVAYAARHPAETARYRMRGGMESALPRGQRLAPRARGTIATS